MKQKSTVGSYVRDVLASVYGFVAAASTAGWLASFYAPQIASARWVLFAVLVSAFAASSFRVYRTQQLRLAQQHDEHQRELATRDHAHELAATAMLAEHRATVEKLELEIDRLSQPPLGAETYRFVEREFRPLNGAYKQAIRYLLIRGEMTDQQMVEFISRINYGVYPTILDGIAEHTPFVLRHDRVPTKEERLLGGFQHRYVINPSLRPALEKLVAEDAELKGTAAIIA